MQAFQFFVAPGEKNIGHEISFLNAVIFPLTMLAVSTMTTLAKPPPPLPEPASLPVIQQLPDPLTFFNGDAVRNARQWNNQRRPELKELFQHYMYGHMPPAPKKVQSTVTRTDEHALGGKGTMKQITLTLGPGDGPKVDVLLFTPNAPKGKVPLFVGINFYGNHQVLDDRSIPLPKSWVPKSSTNIVNNRASDLDRGKQTETWAIEQTIDRGYAFATFYHGDVEPDNKDNTTEGIRAYYRKIAKTEKEQYDWGAIAAWAWGFHRVIDCLQSENRIDKKRMAVVGHSRNGKAAILAAAFDERIALAIPLQAGCGGTAPSRGKVGEQVKQINDHFPHWFNANFKLFNDAPEKIPFDQHALVALCAPRPVLFSNAQEDSWANPNGQFDVLRAADPVYHFLGVDGAGAKSAPPMNELLNSRLGYFIRPGKHSMTTPDWRAFLDYSDRWLKN